MNDTRVLLCVVYIHLYMRECVMCMCIRMAQVFLIFFYFFADARSETTGERALSCADARR